MSSGNQAHRDFRNLRVKQPACETSNLGVDDVDNSKQRRIIQANGGRNPLKQEVLFLQIWHVVEILYLLTKTKTCL